ncbi:hypothetical protein L1987_12103 [Smallanthus sonchifolius]|uniref:Uncharacterized protein n=1 Tax=Smallanthus sonchifolius TaxID=185202 RepID=A0ACB9JDP3_9ASTR|nr:hypothetical protein L1987_12103 [Smallanthus sonchifolius]
MAFSVSKLILYFHLPPFFFDSIEAELLQSPTFPDSSIRRKMNYCGMQQRNSIGSSCDEMRNAVSVAFDRGEPMVCPKPRRLSLFNTPANEPVRPLRWHMCYQPEPYESKAGLELLEIIFENAPVASSSPYFSGSPPSRVSNPLTQDSRFTDGKASLISGRTTIPVPIPASGMSSLSSSSSGNKVGPVGGNFGSKPAVRIEGFDCIPTLA